MKKENNILITLGDINSGSSDQLSKIKVMNLSEIEESCQTYNPNTNYLQVLTNLLLLTSRIQEGGENDLP